MARKPKRKAVSDKGPPKDDWQAQSQEPLARMLALQPGGDAVVVSSGSELRVVHSGSGQSQVLSTGANQPPHTGPIRLLAFSPDGSLMLSGGDDKAARLWDTATWTLKATWRITKRGTAGTFSADNRHAIFADKFGDVLVGDCQAAIALAAADAVPAAPSGAAQLPKKVSEALVAAAAFAAAAAAAAALPSSQHPQDAATMFGHYNSIITSLTASPDGRFIVSTDRDHKVRVSTLPEVPAKGCWVIQSFCMGHAAFVMASAFVPAAAGAAAGNTALLVSGGGDGTVRLWDYLAGELLDTYVAAVLPPAPAAAEGDAAAAAAAAGTSGRDEAHEEAAAAAAAAAGKEEEEEAGARGGDSEDDEEAADGEGPSTSGRHAPSVLSVATSPDGRLVAAVVEGEDEVQILRLDAVQCSLALQQRIALPSVRFPCQVAFDGSGRLWVLGGPRSLSTHSAHVGVAAPAGDSAQFEDCTASALPGDARALLECRIAEEEAALEQQPGAAPAVEGGAPLSYCQHLARYPQDTERSMARKANRNDLKESARLAMLRAAGPIAAAEAAAPAGEETAL